MEWVYLTNSNLRLISPSPLTLSSSSFSLFLSLALFELNYYNIITGRRTWGRGLGLGEADICFITLSDVGLALGAANSPGAYAGYCHMPRNIGLWRGRPGQGRHTPG